MIIKEEYISDSEIRVVGNNTPKPPTRKPWKWMAGILALIALILIGWGIYAIHSAQNANEEIGVFESSTIQQIAPQQPLKEWFQELDTITTCGTEIKDLTINDIPLRVYVPLNTTPHLEVGYGVTKKREQLVLFFQAADVRADNGKIVGVFVQKGKQKSKSMSKKGYCAIINDTVTIGVAENSPLFEQAIEQDGDFFRQYPLVDNGQLVENELRNKAIRRALCQIDNHVAVVETQTMESLHDFAQALVDIGTHNAIYLVGGTAIGWSRDTYGNEIKMGLWDAKIYKNVSFIVWPLQ